MKIEKVDFEYIKPGKDKPGAKVEATLSFDVSHKEMGMILARSFCDQQAEALNAWAEVMLEWKHHQQENQACYLAKNINRNAVEFMKSVIEFWELEE